MKDKKIFKKNYLLIVNTEHCTLTDAVLWQTAQLVFRVRKNVYECASSVSSGV